MVNKLIILALSAVTFLIAFIIVISTNDCSSFSIKPKGIPIPTTVPDNYELR